MLMKIVQELFEIIKNIILQSTQFWAETILNWVPTFEGKVAEFLG